MSKRNRPTTAAEAAHRQRRHEYRSAYNSPEGKAARAAAAAGAKAPTPAAKPAPKPAAAPAAKTRPSESWRAARSAPPSKKEVDQMAIVHPTLIHDAARAAPSRQRSEGSPRPLAPSRTGTA